METNFSTLEHSVSNDPIRSFRCTFCNKGFSNAQALGGHMNIHRRDKAKLKLPAVNKDSITNVPVIIHETELASSEDILCSVNIPWRTRREEDDGSPGGDIQQLPLFAETPSSSHCQGGVNPSGSLPDYNSRSGGHDQLDLELRLGHETAK
ncbi:hypothetical protein ACHQM5_010302 [Ranunculus cassubicifolius]